MIREVIIHCSATEPQWMADRPLAEKVAEIRRWHVQGNGWRDIGYHYLIDRNGDVMPGRRPETKPGAHVKGRNKGTIGVCLIGGRGAAATDTFGEHFTPSQDTVLRNLIGQLMRRHGDLKISGHNEYAAKGCPGFHVPTWVRMLPPRPVVEERPKGFLARFIASIIG